MRPPLFSVIIVTRNRANVIAGSVRSVLRQDFDAMEYELIVVDNGSDDDTLNIVKELQQSSFQQMEVVTETRPGVSHARNAGRLIARGKWILYLDDDALAPTNLLHMYQAWINKYPESDAWGGGAKLKYPVKLPHFWSSHFDGMLSALDLGNDPIIMAFPMTPYGLNMMIKREVLEALGGFRNEIVFGGDETDLFWRMEKKQKIIRYAPDCVVTHAVDLSRFSYKWLLSAAYRSGGYHRNFDKFNGNIRVGWKMISSGWLMVVVGRRGFIPVAFAMHILRVLGYLHKYWGK